MSFDDPIAKVDLGFYQIAKVDFGNNYLAEMWRGSEEGSYLRLIVCFITQL